jgi:hypothetical protein
MEKCLTPPTIKEIIMKYHTIPTTTTIIKEISQVLMVHTYNPCQPGQIV